MIREKLLMFLLFAAALSLFASAGHTESMADKLKAATAVPTPKE